MKTSFKSHLILGNDIILLQLRLKRIYGCKEVLNLYFNMPIKLQIQTRVDRVLHLYYWAYCQLDQKQNK